MTRPGGLGFVADSFANLLVGAAALGHAVILPAVVVRRFGTDQYGTWYLAFQIAAYVLLLDLGSQYLVTNEAARLSPDHRAARFATAAATVQSGLALAVVGAAAAWAGVTGQSTLSQLIAILGAAAIASLSASTVRAWFVGLRRAHVPAVWLVGARAASMAGLFLALTAQADLVTLSAAVALPQLLIHAGLLLWARHPPSPWARPDRAAFLGLSRRCLPLALWTVCGVLITGVDLFIVRVVDPSEVGRYALALPLLAVPTGVVAAAITAWMPRLARSDSVARGGRDLTVMGTTVMAGVLSIGAIPLVAYADDLLGLYAGAGDWGSAAGYVQLLYVALCLRFVFLPWTILILVRNKQGMITWVPVAEAGTNLAASVLLGLKLGAVGVAIGTMAGAIVAMTLNLLWAVPRTSDGGVTPSALVLAAGRAWAPLAAAAGVACLVLTDVSTAWRAIATIVALGIGGWWLLVWGKRTQSLVGELQRSPQE